MRAQSVSRSKGKGLVWFPMEWSTSRSRSCAVCANAAARNDAARRLALASSAPQQALYHNSMTGPLVAGRHCLGLTCGRWAPLGERRAPLGKRQAPTHADCRARGAKESQWTGASRRFICKCPVEGRPSQESLGGEFVCYFFRPTKRSRRSACGRRAQLDGLPLVCNNLKWRQAHECFSLC